VAMARPLRLDIENGWYHVINRGLEKRQIFPDERTNLHFLELLSVLPTRFGLKIHAYVLMYSHYHLQVETPKANLSQAIQWLNVSYSTWFNWLHRRVGPLFQASRQLDGKTPVVVDWAAARAGRQIMGRVRCLRRRGSGLRPSKAFSPIGFSIARLQNAMRWCRSLSPLRNP
jgi:REP element-mobilizing transposase RayT